MRNVYCDADVFLGWFNREQDKLANIMIRLRLGRAAAQAFTLGY